MRMATLSSSSSAPQMASLIFMRSQRRALHLDGRAMAIPSLPSFPPILVTERESSVVTGLTPLDPRFRGDDADVPDRVAALARARGHLRHLTIPTAFMVAPRSASALAMNLAKSSGPS